MRCLVALVFAALLSGCAAAMVDNGQLRHYELRRLLARTAAVRGLPLPDQLETRVVQRENLRALLRQLLEDEWTVAELREAQEMMATMGLWPDGLDLIDETIRVQAGEVAGLYSPERRTLYLIEGVELPALVTTAAAISGGDYTEFVLSHEIVHALQHHAFPQLFEVTTAWHDQDDAVFALHAAIEGDALRYGLEALAPDSELPSSDLFRQFVNVENAAHNLADAPAVLRYALLFPYANGYPLAVTEAKHLLASPPVSTEQAQHADKRREAFWSFSLKNAEASLPAGCGALGENTMGELLISVLLRDLGEGIDAGAWRGWNGDRYLVARCGGLRQFLWMTSWDSEEDAREFEAAYRTVAAAVGERAELDPPPQSVRRGTEVVVFTAGLAPMADAVEDVVVRTRVANLGDLVAVLGRR